MIIGLQIIALLFSFSMIYFALINYKRKEINRLEMGAWTTVWVAVFFVTVFPELLRTLSMRFFITRLFDLMIVGGFILVIALVSIMYLKVKRMEKSVVEFIRKETLKDVQKKK